MLVNISGNRCIGCARYTQYYGRDMYGEFQSINCGYCGRRQRVTKPGDRCRYYEEKSNVSSVFWMKNKD